MPVTFDDIISTSSSEESFLEILALLHQWLKSVENS
jgi:hypothetical protein